MDIPKQELDIDSPRQKGLLGVRKYFDRAGCDARLTAAQQKWLAAQ
jgi:hypothetical protein